MSDLAVSALITGALADLLIDGANWRNYELHPDTKAETSVAWRKQTASNDMVEGSYTTSAVRENVEEKLSIWVMGATTSAVELNLYELQRRLEQRAYTVALTLDGVTHTWTCTAPAQLAITRQREHLHAHTTLVAASLSRLPKETITGAFGTRTT